ncbi:hypothetical protein O3P69_016235 [Scylla paramamosain]|uniref:Metalloendopeptidase n=1 Tax=Scylla paramamosain TaxID=85552 RepID=A0AAW0SA94_SCYPA
MDSGLNMMPLLTGVAILFVVHTSASSPPQTQSSSTTRPTPIIDDQANIKDHTSIMDSTHEEREKSREDHLKLTRNFLETNPERVEDHEGDMLLTPEQWQAITGRKATEVDRRAVFAAINHWETHTCIRFHLTDNTAQPHLRFMKGQGCYSYVGLVFQTGQDVSIGEGCTRSRPERDDHVYINTDNILGNYRSNFDIVHAIENYSVAYDLSSVMHYRSKAFSAKGNTTIATKNLRYQSVPGQRDGLSHRDILLANMIYGCTGLKRITNIIALKCFRPKITFSYFRLYPRRPYCGGYSCCYFDSLEIRTEAPYSQGAV